MTDSTEISQIWEKRVAFYETLSLGAELQVVMHAFLGG